jgi:hypothetical protein
MDRGSRELLVARRVGRVLRRLKCRELMILVWGPGKRDPAYTKRKDIRRELQSQFPNAAVHFSEDERLRCLTRGKVLRLSQEELLQAMAADLIFVLDSSKGAGEEIARYSAYPFIARKMVVLSHERFRGVPSFATDVRVPLAVEWFSDNDYDSCHLAKIKCPKHVMGWLLSRI